MKATSAQKWKIILTLKGIGIKSVSLNEWIFKVGERDNGKQICSDIINALNWSKPEIELYLKTLGFIN